MESTNLHHQHQQDQQQAVLETSSLSPPSCYGIGSSHSWPPNITLNNAGNFDQNLQEAFSRSRTSTQKHDIQVSPLNGSMIRDLGYNWASGPESSITSIKEENISDHTFPKFTDLLNSPSSMENYRLPPHTTHLKNDHHKDDHLNVLSEKLLLKTLSSGEFYSSTAQNYPNFGTTGVLSRGNFSQIYPSINISNLNQSSSAISSSLDMNMQSMDLSTTARINNGGLSQRLQDGVGGFTESLSFRLDNMQNPTDRSPSNSSNPSHFSNGMAETKRPSALIEPKASQPLPSASKKSRSESRISCPPFKVRKEKLGDRIAALQQLVAPFGKTDTASVLMEAIGYIKFLQSQVETLSVPYMKSSRNQTNRSVMHHGSSTHTEEEGKEEARQDLRSRGLCLVPLSCMSYITGDGGSGVWQQPNFGGTT